MTPHFAPYQTISVFCLHVLSSHISIKYVRISVKGHISIAINCIYHPFYIYQPHITHPIATRLTHINPHINHSYINAYINHANPIIYIYQTTHQSNLLHSYINLFSHISIIYHNHIPNRIFIYKTIYLNHHFIYQTH